MERTDDEPLFVHRRECPACGARATTSIYARAFDDDRMRAYMDAVYYGHVEYAYLERERFKLVECGTCGLIFQAHVLGESLAKRLYDVWIDPGLARQWREEDMRTALPGSGGCAVLLSALRLLSVEKPRPLKVLDYGAGFGELAVLAMALGFDVTALEFADDRVAELRSRGIRTVKSLDALDQEYDLVILTSVLEHLSAPMRCLLSVRDSMRADGIIYIYVPDCRHLKSRVPTFDRLSIPEFKAAMLQCSALQHVNSFNHKSLAALLSRAGLEIVGRPLLAVGQPTDPRGLVKQTLRPWYHWARSKVAPGTTVFARAPRL